MRNLQELQQSNIKCTIIPPAAHWQLGKAERRGDVLQSTLTKYEEDHETNGFQDLQTALAHCTAAKNACSLKHGFAPEVLVFGKGLRLPGSFASDDMLPAHSLAISEKSHGVRFRQESARKDCYDADNKMSLRRAALRRSCPDRGRYEPGEWFMFWHASEVKG